MTFLAIFAILLDIPILREIVVFIFLTFTPGFAILRLFKLKEINFIEIILFSVGLSIAFVMFMGLLVNELYLFLGFSQSLSLVPLTVAVSAFTLGVFFIEYRHDLSEPLKLETSFEGKLKTVFPVCMLLVLLPILSAIGVLYQNVPTILFSYTLIAALCLLSAVSRKLIPEKLFPFLIFSISIALVCQVPLTSKYIVGYDANLEYYVFKLTQINGHWGFLNATANPLVTLTFNSMLSITLLPAVYSVLMNAQGDLVFKILYPFIFSLVPLALYSICEKQFGKLIGLLSAIFFIFTSTAFYGSEPLGLNRQIVGELFLLLSVFLLLSKAIPVTKGRLLLIIFGAALAVSHYSLAYFYLGIVAVVFVISKVKPSFKGTLNTVTVLLLFDITFSWYAITSAPLVSLINAISRTFTYIITGVLPNAGTAASIIFIPQAFTVATWINLLVSGIANLFLIIGVLLIILRPKGTGISAKYSVMVIMAAIAVAVSYFAPSIASILNFTRFYGITLLFLAPCFVLGGQALLATIGKAWKKIKRPKKLQIVPKNKNVNIVFLLIAIILGAYFLSQVGFVNNVTNSAIHSYTLDFTRLQTTNSISAKINYLYDVYIPEQDVFSASWLQSYKATTAEVFADTLSGSHALTSYGLIPVNLILPINNTLILPQGSFIYLGTLNIASGTISSTQSFNTSEISSSLNGSDLVYSNGNSQIYIGTG